MQRREPKTRTRPATHQLAGLLGRAERCASDLGGQLEGEARAVAFRIARHLDYLRQVSDLLGHEMQRGGARAPLRLPATK